MKLPTMLGIGCVRLVILPILGIAVMKGADLLSILPPNDPLFRFVLLLQFAMPTAINLGKVAYLWTYMGLNLRDDSQNCNGR
jgi:predicted permease